MHNILYVCIRDYTHLFTTYLCEHTCEEVFFGLRLTLKE
jgi:hypothetical protein